MSDDPYDFEIALPAAATSAARSERRKRSNSDSDEHASGASSSLSNMSGISSDEDSARHPQNQIQSSFKGPTKNLEMGGITASSSGSALDRAKTFLSKYPSVTTKNSHEFKAGGSSRSRRVNLDSDDEDFSLEFSSGHEEKRGTGDSKPGFLTTPDSVVAPLERERDSVISFERYDGVNVTHVRDTDAFHIDDEDSSRINDHAPPYSESRIVAATNTRNEEEDSSNRNQEGDSVDSFHSVSEETSTDPPPVDAPAKVLTILSQPLNRDLTDDGDDDYNGSFHEESIASHSNATEHQDLVIPNSQVGATIGFSKLNRGFASESGAYDDDAFEDEELAVATIEAANRAEPDICSTVMTPQPALQTEGTFDYSMDFSEDGNGDQERLQAPALGSADGSLPQKIVPDPYRFNYVQSSDDGSGGEQSTFLESESDQENILRSFTTPHAAMNPNAEQQRVDSMQESSNHSSISAGNSVPHNQNISTTAQQDQHASIGTRLPLTPKSFGSSFIPPERLTPEFTASEITLQITPNNIGASIEEENPANKRPHVTIIRECGPDQTQPVEMKDASTQFTGNHAAIQTDLVPDGMHNLFVSSTPASIPSPSVQSELPGRDVESPLKSTTCGYDRSERLPPPPASSLFGNSMYCLDTFKLPMTTSTSFYKQQLLALQEQILQKKRETERIVQDRMNFRYSSLRGTEQFIAAQRSQKLELWEALMRVDPTLDERKAREVASLAQTAST